MERPREQLAGNITYQKSVEILFRRFLKESPKLLLEESMKNNKRYSYLWTAPAILIYIVFFIIPFFQGIYYSFTYWSIFDARFAGLENYINILTNPKINIALKNTFIFTGVTVVFKMGFGLILAIILNRKLKTANFMRAVYFMPAVISNVAIALIFSAVLHPTTGILNQFLNSAGLGFMAQNWLTNPKIVMFSISAIEVWKWTGFTMVILLAGLQTIPQEYYEAAQVDGVTGWQKFRYITMPLLMPSVNNAVILSIVGGLKVFDLVYAMTGGGPGNASEVLNTYVFKAYGNGFYGEACAASVILGILVVTVSLITLKPLKKKEVEV